MQHLENCKCQNINFASSGVKVKHFNHAKIHLKFLLGRAAGSPNYFFLYSEFSEYIVGTWYLLGAFKANYPFVEGAGFSLKAMSNFLKSQVDLH